MIKNIPSINNSINIGLTTNALLLTKEKINNIIPFLNRIRIHCLSYDSLFSKSNFNETIDNKIRYIKKINKNINITLNYVINANSINEIKNLLDYCLSNEISLKLFEHVKNSIKKYNKLLSNIDKYLTNKSFKNFYDEKFDKNFIFKNYKSLVRLAFAYCNNKNETACKALGEIRFLPNRYMGHCLLSRKDDKYIGNFIDLNKLNHLNEVYSILDKKKGSCKL